MFVNDVLFTHFLTFSTWKCYQSPVAGWFGGCIQKSKRLSTGRLLLRHKMPETSLQFCSRISNDCIECFFAFNTFDSSTLQVLGYDRRKSDSSMG